MDLMRALTSAVFGLLYICIPPKCLPAFLEIGRETHLRCSLNLSWPMNVGSTSVLLLFCAMPASASLSSEQLCVIPMEAMAASHEADLGSLDL